MTELYVQTRATWTGTDFAITVDCAVSPEGEYLLSPNDAGARVIESLRAHGYHVVDYRAEYHEALLAEHAGADPEPAPEPETPPAKPIPSLSL